MSQDSQLQQAVLAEFDWEPGVSSQVLMVHSYPVYGRKDYGPGSAWLRHDDRGNPSSDKA
ncbi:hypothetical protein HN018_25595 (plasmid) [Lichenicola cladoniae]|uniref:Uncharacterized protein n=1 Tax=Lichenicola cladoniae TaxID=1484109 RepID=A0A6M8HXP2_9PROT|nr:hypothetical protein [Lichenicola cladoniae]NPD66772.1 hypothetical protein [Acetobacteraceae bacterium]QKE93293.1 hypothetical protein HN018_25595 [Lichenicola cladoniae]